MKETCKNCGGDYSIHHSETLQCPFGGVEAGAHRPDTWIASIFERETENEMRQARKDVREDLDKARNEVNAVRKEMADARREISKEVEQLKKDVDGKIQKAIDNPLANK